MVGWRHPRRRATHLHRPVRYSADHQLAHRRPRRDLGDRDVEQRGPAASARLGRGWARLSASPHAVRSGIACCARCAHRAADRPRRQPGNAAVTSNPDEVPWWGLPPARPSSVWYTRIARPGHRSALSSSVVHWSERGRDRVRYGPASEDPSCAARQPAESSYRPSAASATQRMHLGQYGAGKRTPARADECLTPRAGQSG